MPLLSPARPRSVRRSLLPLAFAAVLTLAATACAPTAPAPDAAGTSGDAAGASALAGQATAPVDLARYTVRFLDQDARPVPGVTLQVCDDAVCQVFVSDEAGACVFELEPRAWEAHVLALPAGYTGDTETAFALSAAGGELVIELSAVEVA